MSATSSAVAIERRLRWSLSTAAVAAIALVGGLVALQLWAIHVSYPLRVTSDVPTYLALLRAMAAHPLAPQSPFLDTTGIATPHATPYMLALALLWRAVAPAGHATDPLDAGRFLGFVGIPVSLATLAMIAFYASRIAGRRQGLLTIPVLLVLFGPAHVIWATDLSFNGFLYSGFYPENVALALALAALLALRGRGRPSLVLATVLTAWTMVESPLIGALLAGLAAADGCLRAVRAEPGTYRSSAALIFGFILGMAWPAYQLNQGMAESGVPGSVLVAGCAAAPALAAMLVPLLRGRVELSRRAHKIAAALTGPRALVWLSYAGAVIVWDLAVWEVLLILQPSSDPLIHSNHLALYWGEDRWRWFFMLGAGTVGLAGLIRLARRGHALPLIWFCGCFGIALLGLVGLPVPVWWRFLLLCQVPLAIGTAAVLLEATQRPVRRVVAGTLAFVFVFKLVTLVDLPTTITYFDSPVQETYALDHLIPSQPSGVVASDPFTSYYIPAATGRHVLTVTKAHVDSPAELEVSTHGYALLHALYAAPDTDWWPAAQALWNADVRFVVLEKLTSLAPVNLEQFSTGPTPLIRTVTDRHMMGRMYWRLGRVGILVHDDPEYAVYRLRSARLFPPPHRPRTRPRPARGARTPTGVHDGRRRT